MVQYKSIISQFIVAIIIIAAILMPATISFAHSLEGHNHYDNCENPSDIHVHQKKIECDLYDVILKKDGVFAFAKAVSLQPQPKLHTTFFFPDAIYHIALQTQNSRGPPAC